MSSFWGNTETNYKVENVQEALYNHTVNIWRPHRFLIALQSSKSGVAGSWCRRMRNVCGNMFFARWRSTSCSYSWATTRLYCVGCIGILYTAIVFHYYLHSYYRVNIPHRMNSVITIDHSTLNHVSPLFLPWIRNIFLISQILYIPHCKPSQFAHEYEQLTDHQRVKNILPHTPHIWWLSVTSNSSFTRLKCDEKPT